MIARNRWLSLVLGLLIGIGVSSPAPADWVNDWISQKTVSAPSYTRVRGQNMLSFGGFNTRWQRGSGPAPLVSFDRFGFRAGCGGIDAKMGGFWFAGIDALVQKVQAIIQNAAAIMFKIALNSISQMLGDAADWVEDVIRQVNGLAVDECQAAQQLVNGTFAKSMESKVKSLWSTITLSEKSQTAGVEPDAAKAAKSMNDTDASPVTEEQVKNEDCPTAVQDLLPINGRESVLRKALRRHALSSFEDVARGMVGDLIISKNTNKGGDTYVTQTLASCYDNQEYSFDNLLDGNVKKKDINGGCTPDTTGGGMLSRITTMMTNISNKLAAGTALTATEQAFLDEVPQAIAYRLQSAAISDTSSAAINDFSVLTATAYAYSSLSDLYRVVRKAANEYQEYLLRDKSKMDKCSLPAIGEVEVALNDWTHKIYERLTALRSYYHMRVTEFNAGTEMTRTVLEETRTVVGELNKKGPDKSRKED